MRDVTPEDSARATSELLDGWRRLGQWSALPWDERPGHRTWNRLVEQLAALERQVLAAPDGPAALEHVAVSGDDAFVRDQARRALDPGVPDDGPARERWARHPRVGLAGVDLHWRPGLLLAPAGPPGDGEPVGGAPDDSHLLGRPSGQLDPWPRRVDGLPLVLLLDVDLSVLMSYGDIGIAPLLGLPWQGRLQVFHDLETLGQQPADGAEGAWLVRHVPVPTGEVQAPEDMEEAGRRPSQPARLLPFPSVTVMGGTDSPEVANALERAERRLVDAVRREAAQHGPSSGSGALRSPGDDELDRDPALGRLPRLLGLPQLPVGEGLAILRTVRPDVEDWQLLAAVPGVGAFDGLLGDLANLEVWAPASHLADGRLDTTWSLLRR